MLRSFRLGNHKSFAEEQELLLMPAQPGDKRPVVPVTAIYGANASGKSNLLDGLAFMQRAVTNSFARWEVDEGVTRNPFRLCADGGDAASVFVVDLIVDNIPYTYGFTLNDDEIREEWLYSYPKKRERKLFERDGDEIRFSSTIDDIKAKLELVESLTRPNSLFLSAIAQTRLEPLMPVYRWFKSQLLMRPSGYYPFSTRIADRINSSILHSPENRKRFVALLQAADIGITDLHIEETTDPELSVELGTTEELIENKEAAFSQASPAEKEKIKSEFERLHRRRDVLSRRVHQRRMELKLEYGTTSFSLGDESAGTVSWLQLLPMVLEALDSGQVVVVDEIDTSLHPLLTTQLIGLFKDAETNPNGAQLIFTTHDASLLGTILDDEALERDQVWFVEKDTDGASSLYPLTDFKPRKEHNRELRYLGGSYGAVPVLDHQDFAEAVLRR
ncbi:MAG: AAA family ATPase [Actinophytocola sp.]|nr:AAA family ATPase [Actinophytocola sp.]